MNQRLATAIKGWQSENNVGRALYIMRCQGFIKWFKRTPRRSLDDLNGVDFWVGFKKRIIPLQVKSSEHYANIHRQKYGDRIRVIVGVGDNLIPRIKEQLRDWIRNHGT